MFGEKTKKMKRGQKKYKRDTADLSFFPPEKDHYHKFSPFWEKIKKKRALKVHLQGSKIGKIPARGKSVPLPYVHYFGIILGWGKMKNLGVGNIKICEIYTPDHISIGHALHVAD